MKSTFVIFLLLLAGCALIGCHFVRALAAPPFRGELHIAKDQSASIAIHPTIYSPSARPEDTASRRYGVQASEIPFSNPALAAQRINPQMLYDIAILPFQLRLTRSTILTPANIDSFLEVRPPGAQSEATRLAITPGQAVRIGAEDLQVESIRPWAGLLRHAAGHPAASVAVRTPAGQWLENLLLEKDSWLYAGNDLAIQLIWHDSSQAARAAAETTAPPSESARWGVVDGGAINWLNSLTPGAGLQLNSGATITLLQVDLAHASENGASAAILLQTDQAGTRKQEWVTANNPDPSLQFKFECPAARGMVFVLHAAQDGSCIASAYYQYRFIGSNPTQEGETWTPTDAPYSLRIDQVLSTGIPVTAQQSSIDEVLLSGPKRTLRIREGETAALRDDQLRFVQDSTPPRLRYELNATPRGATSAERTITLEPGQQITLHGVTLAPGTVNPRKTDLATLTVTIRTSYTLAVLGALLLVAGLLLLIRKLHS